MKSPKPSGYIFFRFYHIEISRDVIFDEEKILRNLESVSMKKYMKRMYLPRK